MRKKYYYFRDIMLCLMLTSLFAACTNDSIGSDSAYTFTGETVTQYFESNPADYSLFLQVLNRAKLQTDGSGSTMAALLSTYGSFTCFAPDNEAMEAYLKKKGLTSVDQITDSAVNVIARMHCVSSPLNNIIYLTQNFTSKLPDLNMYQKSMYLEAQDDSYILNSQAVITEKDIEVYNGVIQRINTVLEASDVKLLDFLKSEPKFSLFADLAEYTDIASRVYSQVEDLDYESTGNTEDISGGKTAIAPEHRYQYFTCFIETNDVFSKQISLADAKTKSDSINAVKVFAKDWFEKAYADDQETLTKGLTEDWKDENNYLNRFVAYHFVNKKIDRTDFKNYGIGMASGYNKYTEYAESLAPNQLIQMSAGKYGNSIDANQNRLQLNPSVDQQPTTASLYANYGWTRPKSDGVFLTETTSVETENGFFHPIDSILTFPRANFKRTRIRFDITSMFPEMMSNGYRCQYTNGKNVNFQSGYLTNITFNSVGTQFIYLNPQKSASYPYWSNVQGDEMTAWGAFDITLRLPPVPKGTYEIRYGFTVAGNRGCGQFYLGSSADNMNACGIPIDLTKSATSYGWVADTKGDEDYDNDRVFRARGWMKGPNSWISANGTNTTTLRGNNLALRRIVGTIDLQKDGSIYLRIRNATSYEQTMFMMDYLEICPASVYDNPEVSEPRD
ncbi:MAG: fasciclin domain-containing protein [Bacteroidaceae bacterium]|nr:fasciclin domain-containing protein [Bacteroidaceae bacterium]MBP9636847.1 fasciclin domain-containing protein [Bacteroidaceae bacterium]